MLSLGILKRKRSKDSGRATRPCAVRKRLKRGIFMKKLAPRRLNGRIIKNATDIQMYERKQNSIPGLSRRFLDK
jgi:hypothetical protein